MRTFHRVHERRRQLVPHTEGRLSIGQSAAVITGLSALSWAVVILAVLALRAII
jgi:hypothetical protein